MARKISFGAIAILACSLSVGMVTESRAESNRARGIVGIRQAERHVEISRLRLQQYVGTEFRLRLKALDADVKVARAEVRLLRKRVDAFPYVSHRDRNDYGSPTTINIKRLENWLLEAELHLDQSITERSAWIEGDRARRRLLKLELESAIDELELLRLESR